MGPGRCRAPPAAAVHGGCDTGRGDPKDPESHMEPAGVSRLAVGGHGAGCRAAESPGEPRAAIRSQGLQTTVCLISPPESPFLEKADESAGCTS